MAVTGEDNLIARFGPTHQLGELRFGVSHRYLHTLTFESDLYQVQQMDH
jgi:hypothetical protein